MSIGAIDGNSPYRAADASQKAQGAEEITTITTQCKKEHNHNQSCPHTVSTQPAPKAGEDGYLFDKRV